MGKTREANEDDTIKILAIALMVIDHIGAFLLVETEWLRIIGRASYPLFCYLIGKREHYRLNRILTIAGYGVTHELLGINSILPGLALIMLFLRMKLNKLQVTSILILSYPLLSIVIMYGVTGYLISAWPRSLIAFLAFGIIQGSNSEYNILSVILMGGIAAWMITQTKLPVIKHPAWLWISRHSLEIYFWHLLLFELIEHL